MSLVSRIKFMIEEISDKEYRLSEMGDAWNYGSEGDAALSDPGLQYELGQEIENDLKSLRDLLIERLSN